MEIGTAIKRLRKTKTRLNQTEFAEGVGITQTYLSQIETGSKIPSMQVLTDIAKFLLIPLPILFWFSVTEADIRGPKKEHFTFLKSSLDEMINSII